MILHVYNRPVCMNFECFVAFNPLTLPAMPSVKPDAVRIALLKAACFSVSHLSMSPEIPSIRCVCVYLWQEFYTERMSEEFRRSRFLELAQKGGLSVTKTEKVLKDGKAPFFQFTKQDDISNGDGVTK